MSDLNSHELLRRVEASDSRAAAAIFDRYVQRLLALARARIGPKLRRRIDAEDVVQSAYRSFFAHAENEEYALTQPGDLWRLLVSIMLNKLYGQVEKHTAARRSINREDAEGHLAANAKAAPEPTPAEVVAIIEQLHLVNKQLTLAERTVLTAHLHGRTNEEIAESLRKSPRTVRRLLAQTKRRIERQLVESESAATHRSNSRLRRGTDPRAPLSYSDYVLERILGAGGMGKVYRATQRSTGKLVAIKSLLKSRQNDVHAVEKFLQEAQVLAKLNHPNIVGVEGVGRFPGGGYFIVMEFVNGTDLQARIAQGPLGVAEALRVVRIVTGAIAHAHEQGIVHGDLKPANILLDNVDRVVVSDFGLAQFIASDATPWLVGGTAGYMAPEVRAYGRLPTPAADIYGLGALLSTLATGTAPGGAAVCGMHVYSNSIAAICANCLAVDPTERLQSVTELLKKLDEIDELK